jgi:hypothetical protein
MCGGLSQLERSRAIITLIALYALCLQVFLVGLAPVQPVSPSGVICAEHAETGAPADKSLPCQHPCCTAAHAVRLLPVLTLAFAALIWPAGQAAPLVWRRETTNAPRAPPDQSVSPRGSPAL